MQAVYHLLFVAQSVIIMSKLAAYCKNLPMCSFVITFSKVLILYVTFKAVFETLLES